MSGLYVTSRLKDWVWAKTKRTIEESEQPGLSATELAWYRGYEAALSAFELRLDTLAETGE